LKAKYYAVKCRPPLINRFRVFLRQFLITYLALTIIIHAHVDLPQDDVVVANVQMNNFAVCRTAADIVNKKQPDVYDEAPYYTAKCHYIDWASDKWPQPAEVQ
jgi:hypothetical protein